MMKRYIKNSLLILLGLFLGLLFTVFGNNTFANKCEPTSPDMLGPFYTPDAPERSSVGKGYVLTGVVRSSRDCSPISGSLIEFWLTGPDGTYDDEHRATMISDEKGRCRFESNYPPPYFGRPSHIHIRVSARGFKTLVTQHYPEKDAKEAVFDLILMPE
jgi:protocatechuate 3,4-dioxygenase beta subunit